LPREPQHLAAVLSGPVRAATWRESAPPPADFFTAKGVLGGVLDALGLEWEVAAGHEPFLHPGRSAKVLVDGQEVGWVGEIHPNVAALWDLEDTVAAFEVDLSAVPVAPVAQYRDLVSYPEVREDMAVVVRDRVTAAQILAVVTKSGSPLLAGAEVFDVYRDAARLGEGNVSVALRLAYRVADRTLTDEEVAAQRQRITNALAKELEGKIRAGS